jgi:tape measure domain-containing protein
MADRVVKVTLIAQAQQFVAEFERAQKATKSTTTEADKLASRQDAFKKLGTVMTVVGGAVTAIGLAAAKTGIDYNTLQQKSRAALTTMLGSAQAANAQMDKLDAFAKTSPFAKQTFITAQQQMLAFGVATKKVIPYLDAVQNAVAASGGGNNELAGIVAIMAKIQSSSKITAEDLNQFGNYGINAAQLIGKAMGKTGSQIRTEITSGSIDATTALDALTKGMQDKFHGAAANVKQTFDGAMDRLKAAWRDFSSELLTPLVDPKGGGALVDLMNWGADMMRQFEALPAPIRETASVLVLAAGGATLLGGAAIIALPKIVAFKAAMAELKINVGAASSAMRLLPWVAVIAGAGQVSASWVDTGLHAAGLKKDVDDLTKSLQNNASAAQSHKTIDSQINSTFGGNQLSQITNSGWAAGSVKTIYDWGNALDKINPVMRFLGNGSADLTERIQNLDKSMANMVHSGDTKQAAADWEYLKSKTDGSKEAIQHLKELFPEYSAAAKDSKAGSKSASDGVDDVAKSAKDASGDVKQLATDLQNFTNGTLDVSQAQVQFSQAVADATKAAKDNGATLDLNTQKGRDNQSALNGMVSSIGGLLSAQAAQGASEDDLKATMESGRQQFIAVAEQMGLNETQANNLADSYGLIPANVATLMQANGFDTSEAAAKRVKDAIDQVPSNKGVSVTVDAYGAFRTLDELNSYLNQLGNKEISVGGGAAGYYGFRQANGGVVDYFARGGMSENHVAQIASAGSMRVWAEPETGGEAYIPLAASKRQRSLSIWAATGKRLGVQGFADGGVTYVSMPSAGGAGFDARALAAAIAPYMRAGNTFNIKSDNPEDAAMAVARRQQLLGA